MERFQENMLEEKVRQISAPNMRKLTLWRGQPQSFIISGTVGAPCRQAETFLIESWDWMLKSFNPSGNVTGKNV